MAENVMWNKHSVHACMHYCQLPGHVTLSPTTMPQITAIAF